MSIVFDCTKVLLVKDHAPNRKEWDGKERFYVKINVITAANFGVGSFEDGNGESDISHIPGGHSSCALHVL